MVSRQIACNVVLLLSVFHTAVSHVVWKHPAPRYDRDDRSKAHPCGTGGQLNDWDAAVTTLSPGKQLLEFRETIVHNGAPSRIALTIENDSRYSDFVLMDHIPHNNGAPRVNGAVLHAVEVEIPPIDCSNRNCGLQLIQVMTDKFSQGQTCANPSGLANSCGNPSFAYFSCSNIKIDGGTVADPAPSYRSWTSGSAGSREPYAKGEVGAWCFDSEKQHWRLHGNGYNCPGMDPIVEEDDTGGAGGGGVESCPRGHGLDTTAQSCEPCGAGLECPMEACTACSTCLEGFYKAAAGSEGCVACPVDTYRSDRGGSALSACVACPMDASTGGSVARASRDACVCDEGFEVQGSGADWTCVAAGEGNTGGEGANTGGSGGGGAEEEQQQQSGGGEQQQQQQQQEQEQEQQQEQEQEQEQEAYGADVKVLLRFSLTEEEAEARSSEIRAAIASALGVSADRVTLSGFEQAVKAAGVTHTIPMVSAEASIAVVDAQQGRALAAMASQSRLEAAMLDAGLEGTLLVSDPSVISREDEAGGEPSAGSRPRGGPTGEQAASLLITAAIAILVLSVV